MLLRIRNTFRSVISSVRDDLIKCLIPLSPTILSNVAPLASYMTLDLGQDLDLCSVHSLTILQDHLLRRKGNNVA